MSGTSTSSSSTTVTQTNPYVRADIGTLASYLVTSLGLTLTSAQVQQALQNFITANGNNPIPLAQLLPDYESNKGEMLSILSGTTSWTNLYAAGIGQTLSEMSAVAQTYNQMAAEKAVQEAVLGTAVLPSSIYEITSMNGVRIPRCKPGQLTASLSLQAAQTTTVTLPAYSQFTVGSVNYYNTSPIVWSPGTLNVNATLWEGTVGTISFTSNGGSAQIYEFGNSDFSISDTDVVVNVAGSAYTSTRWNTYLCLGLWEYGPTDLVYIDWTNSAGNVELRFGDNNYGTSPAAGAAINITFATTSGAAGNQQLSGQTISCPANTLVTGVALTNTQGGTNQLSPQTLKFLTPAMFFGNYRAITPADYRGVALLYPGVIDALFLGQRTFAPNDLTYMMNVQAFLLTSQAWTTTQWTAFVTYMNNLIGANIVLLQESTTPLPINIVLNVFCFSQTDLDAVQNAIISTINTSFALQAGVLGYSRYKSDIGSLAKSAAPSSIDYITIPSPTDEAVATQSEYVVINTLTVNMNYTTRGVYTG